MNDHKKFKQLLERALYNELNPVEESFFTRHSESCPTCAREYESLKKTLTVFADTSRKEPIDDFATTLWNTIEPRLEKNKESFGSRVKEFTLPFNFNNAWTYRLAGGLAVLIIGIAIGIYLGRGTAPLQTPLLSQQTDSLTQQMQANVDAARYIERSKTLLLGLMNIDENEGDLDAVNIPYQQKISRELITQASGLKTALSSPSQQQIRKLVSDIELILMQFANMDAKYDLAGIDMVKEGVKTKGIILKIYIHEMNEHNNNAKQQQHNNSKESTKI